MFSNEELARQARKRAEDKVGFYVHLGMYVAVNAFLVFIWWFSSGAGFPWFVFPMFGWGIGIVAHFLVVFVGKGVVDRMTAQELQRLRRDQA